MIGVEQNIKLKYELNISHCIDHVLITVTIVYMTTWYLPFKWWCRMYIEMNLYLSIYLSIYLRVYSLHHNVPTLQPIHIPLLCVYCWRGTIRAR